MRPLAGVLGAALDSALLIVSWGRLLFCRPSLRPNADPLPPVAVRSRSIDHVRAVVALARFEQTVCSLPSSEDLAMTNGSKPPETKETSPKDQGKGQGSKESKEK